jgi:hypothetical protein
MENQGAETSDNAGVEPTEDIEGQQQTEGVEGDEPSVKAETEEHIPEEPEDQRERSRLGRKVKYLSDAYEQLNQKLDQVMNLLVSNTTQKKEETPEDLDPAFAEEVLKVIQRTEMQRQQQQALYTQQYLNTIERLGLENDPETHDSILALMEKDTRFRQAHTGNAEADALLNYQSAMNAVLRQKLSQKSSPTKGVNAQTGVAAAQRATAMPPKKVPKLSPYAARLKDAFGLSDEMVSKALEEQ